MRDVLTWLTVLIPRNAPAVDDELVQRWAGHIEPLSAEEAHETAVALSRRWRRRSWVTPAAFSEMRRDIVEAAEREAAVNAARAAIRDAQIVDVLKIPTKETA